MQQGSKRLFSMVVTLVCVIAAFVIFFQFVRPAYLEAQDVRAQVIARENLLEAQSQAIEQVQQLIQKYRSDAAVQQTVSQVIPSKPEVGSALYQLASIASQYGIQFQSTTAQTPQLSIAANARAASSTVGAVRPLGVATFQVRFVARYEDLKEFLGKIEGNVRIMDVTAISITQGTTPGLLAVDLSVSTYYQAPQ